jgi:hypothetical protein
MLRFGADGAAPELRAKAHREAALTDGGLEFTLDYG